MTSVWSQKHKKSRQIGGHWRRPTKPMTSTTAVSSAALYLINPLHKDHLGKELGTALYFGASTPAGLGALARANKDIYTHQHHGAGRRASADIARHLTWSTAPGSNLNWDDANRLLARFSRACGCARTGGMGQIHYDPQSKRWDMHIIVLDHAANGKTLKSLTVQQGNYLSAIQQEMALAEAEIAHEHAEKNLPAIETDAQRTKKAREAKREARGYGRRGVLHLVAEHIHTRYPSADPRPEELPDCLPAGWRGELQKNHLLLRPPLPPDIETKIAERKRRKLQLTFTAIFAAVSKLRAFAIMDRIRGDLKSGKLHPPIPGEVHATGSITPPVPTVRLTAQRVAPVPSTRAQIPTPTVAKPYTPHPKSDPGPDMSQL